jgi:hypothetical protein
MPTNQNIGYKIAQELAPPYVWFLVASFAWCSLGSKTNILIFHNSSAEHNRRLSLRSFIGFFV